MSTPSSSPPGPSLTPYQASPLLTSFTTFLTLAIHSLLYHRNLYPPTTFLLARAYDLPVRQSRHPGVCAWVNDAVAAVRTQLLERRVRRIALAVHAPPGGSEKGMSGSTFDDGENGHGADDADEGFKVLERWVFDIESFPAWGKATLAAEKDYDSKPDSDINMNQPHNDADPNTGEASRAPRDDADCNMTDVQQSLRGALLRLSQAAESSPKLPPGCTFTLAVELHDEAPAPIAHPQEWIPSEPEMQPGEVEEERGSVGVVPVRSVRAGPLFFECWYEQGRSSGERRQPGSETYSQFDSSLPGLKGKAAVR